MRIYVAPSPSPDPFGEFLVFRGGLRVIPLESDPLSPIPPPSIGLEEGSPKKCVVLLGWSDDAATTGVLAREISACTEGFSIMRGLEDVLIGPGMRRWSTMCPESVRVRLAAFPNMMSCSQVEIWVVAVLLLTSSCACGMKPRRSAETGSVRVLYIGEPVGGPGPYRFMEQDPFLEMTPVQATTAWYELDIIKRSLRIYMPRSYQNLVKKEDIVILSDANRNLFSGTTLKWFSDAVLKEGMGLLMTGGRESFGAYFGMPDWTPTPVGKILPVESTGQNKGPDGKVEVLKPKNVFMASLPWESIGGYGFFYGCNPVTERDGAEILAQLVPKVGVVNPFLVWWDIGEGRTFAMTADWTPAGANEFLKWEFYPDFAVNLMLFIADVEIPPDPIQVHRIRRKLEEYHLKRSFVISLIDFISRLGANPSKVETMLKEADDGLREVRGMYVDYDFDGSLVRAQSLVEDLDLATKAAFRLKDQALLWIYVTEWAAITGTSMGTGFLLWTLMVKRRLYREVGTTKGFVK